MLLRFLRVHLFLFTIFTFNIFFLMFHWILSFDVRLNYNKFQHQFDIYHLFFSYFFFCFNTSSILKFNVIEIMCYDTNKKKAIRNSMAVVRFFWVDRSQLEACQPKKDRTRERKGERTTFKCHLRNWIIETLTTSFKSLQKWFTSVLQFHVFTGAILCVS